MRRTKIVATLGPAAASEERIRSLVRGGVDVVRLNFSHGDREEHAKNAHLVREAARELGRNVAILQDMQGPKIRVGEVVGGTELVPGNRVSISPGDFLGDASKLPVSYKGITSDVSAGHRLLIDDGLLELKVDNVEGGEIVCTVVEGGEISSHKGINFPDSTLSISGMTEKDVEDLRFAIEEVDPDWIAASFVRSGDEVFQIKEKVAEMGGEVPLVSKIEKHEAIADMENILQVSDAVMVARGDLAVELSAEQVPVEQKRIITRCRRLGRPVIVATQMLDSMIRNPRPTRAEVSDVANAIFDRADAVMLSGETAVGRYPLQSVREMERICRAVEEVVDYSRDVSESSEWGRGDLYNALTHAACELAEDLDAEAIIASTQSGRSALRVARFRPPNSVVAVTPVEKTARKLALVWGVSAVTGEQVGNMEDRFNEAIHAAEENGLVQVGDRVIITGGVMSVTPGSTNLLKVHTIGEDR